MVISLFPWHHSGEQQKTSASAIDQIVILSIILVLAKNLTIRATLTNVSTNVISLSLISSHKFCIPHSADYVSDICGTVK